MLAPGVAPQSRGTHLLMFKGFIPCAVLLFLFLLIQRIRLAVMIRHRPYAHHKIQLKAVSRLFKTATCRVVYARTECRYVNVLQPLSTSLSAICRFLTADCLRTGESCRQFQAVSDVPSGLVSMSATLSGIAPSKIIVPIRPI